MKNELKASHAPPPRPQGGVISRIGNQNHNEQKILLEPPVSLSPAPLVPSPPRTSRPRPLNPYINSKTPRRPLSPQPPLPPPQEAVVPASSAPRPTSGVKFASPSHLRKKEKTLTKRKAVKTTKLKASKKTSLPSALTGGVLLESDFENISEVTISSELASPLHKLTNLPNLLFPPVASLFPPSTCTTRHRP